MNAQEKAAYNRGVEDAIKVATKAAVSLMPKQFENAITPAQFAAFNMGRLEEAICMAIRKLKKGII